MLRTSDNRGITYHAATMEYIELGVYSALAVIFSAAVAIFVTGPVAVSVVRLFASKHSLDPDAVAGCEVLPTTFTVSLVATIGLWFAIGWAGLLGVLAGPVIISIREVLRLRVAGSAVSQREFSIEAGRIHMKDQELQPAFLIERTDESGVGYASVYILELHSADGVLATNIYPSDEARAGDLRQLVFVRSVPSMNVAIACFADDQVRSVELGSEWGWLILSPGSTTIPENSKLWWATFASPALGEDEARELDSAELRGHVEAVDQSLGEEKPGELARDFDALKRLTDLNQPLLAMRADYLEKVWTPEKLGDGPKRVGWSLGLKTVENSA